MPLEQQIAALITNWNGLDAAERTARMDELVRQLAALVRNPPVAIPSMFVRLPDGVVKVP